MDKVEKAAAKFRKANDAQLNLTASLAAKEAQIDRFDMAAQVRNQRQETKPKRADED